MPEKGRSGHTSFFPTIKYGDVILFTLLRGDEAFSVLARQLKFVFFLSAGGGGHGQLELFKRLVGLIFPALCYVCKNAPFCGTGGQ